MANRYFGDFRSLDQSVDDRGQRYRVVIFTGYDGTNPYPYIKYGGYSVPTEDGPDRWIPARYVPSNGTMLTMCANPFIVEYVGDEDPYKPYRCSRASITFIQDKINTEFINTLGQEVLVLLLRWKNEVVESGDQMVNTITGATLSKIRVYDPDPPFEDVDITLYYGYDIKAYEKFCYDVEWIGFVEPSPIQHTYDHTIDAFTLEAQDALSILQNSKFVRSGQMETMTEGLLRMLASTGCYRNVFITKNIHFPGEDNVHHYTNNQSLMSHISYQQDNNLNENGEPETMLDCIDRMLRYCGLTITTWKDGVVVGNPNLTTHGFTTFERWQLPDNDLLWNLPEDGLTYTKVDDVDLASTIKLNKDWFVDSGLTVNSNDVYNKVKVVCDEMRPDPLIPDWSDDGNLADIVPSQPLEMNMWNRHYSGGQWVIDNYYYVEGYFMHPVEMEDLKLYTHQYDSFNTTDWGGSHVTYSGVVRDRDLQVANNRTYPGQSADSYNRSYVRGIYNWEYSHDDYGNITPGEQFAGPIAMVTDWHGAPVEDATSQPDDYSFNRSILFHCYNTATLRAQSNGSQAWMNHDWDDKTTYWQPLMYVRSKPFFGNGKQWLNITGDWKFYLKGPYDQVNWIPVSEDVIPVADGMADYCKYNKNYAFLWTKVRCGKYWLVSSERGVYSWTVNESFCKLWLKNSIGDGESYNDKSLPFETVVRGIEGISIELPVQEGYGEPMQVEFWFDRPLGPGTGACNSAVLTDFNVNIYSDKYVQSRKRVRVDEDNTEYNTGVVEGAVSEAPNINLAFSSTDEAGLSYAEVTQQWRIRRTAGEVMYANDLQVFNDATTTYGIPERQILNSYKGQYKAPRISIDLPIYRVFDGEEPKMYSRILWGQLPGCLMMIDSMNINYEYEQMTIHCIEVPVVTDQESVTVNNRTRNYLRTGDIAFGNRLAIRRPAVLAIRHINGSGDDQFSVDEENQHVMHESELAINGAGRFNIDWHGDARMYYSTPIDSGITARRTPDGHVIVVTT